MAASRSRSVIATPLGQRRGSPPTGSQPRTILISADFPPTVVGGSVAYVHNLVQHLDVPVDVLTTGSRLPTDREVIGPPHGVIRTPFLIDSRDPSRPRLAIMYLYVLLGLPIRLLLGRYRLVISSSGVMGNAIAVLVCRILRVPVVVLAYAEEITIPLASPGMKGRLKSGMVRRFYPRADGFISVCDFTRDLLTGLGVAPERVCVIPPMVGASKTDAAATPRSLKLPNEGPLILSVGRLVVRKGFDRLIEAVALLRQRYPGIRLVIAGDGPERVPLQELVVARGLEDQVSVAGRVSDEALVPLYAEADVFVLANVMLANGDCEGAPTVLVEASAHGIPVVAGRQGGSSNVVEDGVSGLLIDASDVVELAGAIGRILGDEELAKQFGAAGRLKATRDHDPKTAGRLASEFLASIAAGRDRLGG